MDALYIIRKSKWDQELRFSLRSLDKHVSGIDRVIIFGYLPPYVALSPSVIHVPWTGNTDPSGENEILIQKVADAINMDILSETFLYMADDFILLADQKAEEITPYLLENMDLTYRGLGDGNNWHKMLWKTYDWCKSKGGTGFNFESHTPKVFNKKAFQQLLIDFAPAWENAKHMCDGICWETAYFNMYPPAVMEYAHGHRVEAINPIGEQEIIEGLCRGREFLFFNETGLVGEGLQSFLNDRFPEPSRWEQY